MTDWIIFYDDGSSFSSDDGKPQDAPKEGAQVVAINDPANGRRLFHSADAYCYHKENEWVPHSDLGVRRYLEQPGEMGIVVRGYAIPYKLWVDIYYKAVNDPRLPAKTGSDPFESGAPAP